MCAADGMRFPHRHPALPGREEPGRPPRRPGLRARGRPPPPPQPRRCCSAEGLRDTCGSCGRRPGVRLFGAARPPARATAARAGARVRTAAVNVSVFRRPAVLSRTRAGVQPWCGGFRGGGARGRGRGRGRCRGGIGGEKPWWTVLLSFCLSVSIAVSRSVVGICLLLSPNPSSPVALSFSLSLSFSISLSLFLSPEILRRSVWKMTGLLCSRPIMAPMPASRHDPASLC